MRLTAIGHLPDIGAAHFTGKAAQGPTATRSVWFSGEEPVEAAVWWRQDLAPGTTIEGPAVIEQLDATTPIPPGYRALVDNNLNLVIGVRQ